jgi:hypothetical protein
MTLVTPSLSCALVTAPPWPHPAPSPRPSASKHWCLFQQPNMPAVSILVVNCCVFLLSYAFLLPLDCLRKGVLLSSPVVAVLSLPRPPPPPSPPLLTDHDLSQRCEAPRHPLPSILHATPHRVCRDQQGQHCSRSHCLSTRSVFNFIFWDLRRTCWATIQSMASTSKPFCSHASGD